MSSRALSIFALAVLLFVSSFSSTVLSAPIDAETARAAGESFLRSFSGATPSATDGIAITGDGRDLAYLFRLEPQGYVVVAADDALPAVIAYSLESDFLGGSAGHDPLTQLIAADLRLRLEALPQLDVAVARARVEEWSSLLDGSRGQARRDRFQQWPPAGSTPTGGWLATNWTQNAPYNNLCPLDVAHGGVRSLAGCPAVAMAMVLNYHQTVQATTFGTGDRYWHAYAGNYYWIPDAAATYGFPDFPTLNGYLATVTSHWGSGTPLTNTDKAALVFACGTAATQVYSASGSGTFGVDQAFDAYQRFAFAGSRLVHDTDPNMYPDLAGNMQNARPAHLAIVDPGWTMGHNVVVDGYNTDNYFHLNFGWGGSYNGWYLLPSEIPYGLTVVEGLILDIVPTPTEVPAWNENADARALTCAPNPTADAVTIRLASTAGPREAVRIFDTAGRLVRSLGGTREGTIWWRTDDAAGRPVAPGIYFARAGDGTAGIRIVVCR